MTHPMTTPPRDLTDEEAADRAEEMFKLDQEIKQNLRAGREAMWHAARAAYTFDEQSGWTALGYENMGEWLADPEVQLTRRTFTRMVRAFGETVVRRGIAESVVEQIDVSKVDIVLGRVSKGEVKIEDALEDAKELGARDLREKYLKREETVATPVNGDITGTKVSDLNKIARGDDEDDEFDFPGSDTVIEGEGEDLPQNGAPAPSGQDPLDVEMATLLWHIQDTYASPEKKKIRREDAAWLDRVLARAVKAGLLDAA